MLRIFHYVAFVEHIMIVALFGTALSLKYGWDMPVPICPAPKFGFH
ncbi:hypothetical protein [Sphingobium sp. CAP-1]|nr:hypothetical protein [Sphingobium sp. CAP-1]QGP80445.1 hypothetical protein GL174_15010 [Sphingobium sp. CAP-1]